MRRDVPLALLTLLARQDGTVTRTQALQHLTPTPLKRLLRNEGLVPVTTAVYRQPTTPPIVARAWAGHLLGGPDSALGGLIVLYRAGITSAPAVIDTWLPSGHPSVRPRHGWAFHRDGEERLTRLRGTLPCVPIEVALVDVGADLALTDWAGVVLDAVRERVVSVERVRQVLLARQRGRQRAARLALLGDLLGLESDLELRFRRDVERAHRLPVGRRQDATVAHQRTDVRYEGLATLVELDGRRGHDGSGVFRDLDRDNVHAVRDDVTLRYGSFDVRGRPCIVAWQVAVRLASQGWPGPFRRCPSCPDPGSLRRAASSWNVTLPPGLLAP